MGITKCRLQRIYSPAFYYSLSFLRVEVVELSYFLEEVLPMSVKKRSSKMKWRTLEGHENDCKCKAIRSNRTDLSVIPNNFNFSIRVWYMAMVDKRAEEIT